MRASLRSGTKRSAHTAQARVSRVGDPIFTRNALALRVAGFHAQSPHALLLVALGSRRCPGGTLPASNTLCAFRPAREALCLTRCRENSLSLNAARRDEAASACVRASKELRLSVICAVVESCCIFTSFLLLRMKEGRNLCRGCGFRRF